MKGNIVREIMIALLVFLFVYTATSKLLNFFYFHYQLKHLPWIGSFADILSVAIPAVEYLIVLLLIFTPTRLIGLYSSFFLLLLFTLYISFALINHQDLPCSCGGVISKLGWRGHILFNLFFIAINILSIKLHQLSYSTATLFAFRAPQHIAQPGEAENL